MAKRVTGIVTYHHSHLRLSIGGVELLDAFTQQVRDGPPQDLEKSAVAADVVSTLLRHLSSRRYKPPNEPMFLAMSQTCRIIGPVVDLYDGMESSQGPEQLNLTDVLSSKQETRSMGTKAATRF
eukprot:665492-Amphidinium_carterae.1